MRPDLWNLYAELERAPEDWSVRLRLIEAAVGEGNLDEARRLVRTSPDEFLPAELRDRIHALLTGADRGPSVGEVLPLENPGEIREV